MLGILTQNDDKSFQFEYKLGSESDNVNLLLSIFPDGNKIYDDQDARLLLDDYLPSETNTAFVRQILKQAGINRYDEWEWLKAFEPVDENAETRLFEILPENVIVHDETIREEITKRTNAVVTDDEHDISADAVDVDSSDDTMETVDNTSSAELIPSDDEFDDCHDPDDLFDDYYDDLNDLFDGYDNSVPVEQTTSDENDFVFDDVEIQNDSSLTPSKKPDNIDKTAPVVRLKKTTVVKKVAVTESRDFALPPLTDPCDLIQERLKQNIASRKEKLRDAMSTDSSQM